MARKLQKVPGVRPGDMLIHCIKFNSHKNAKENGFSLYSNAGGSRVGSTTAEIRVERRHLHSGHNSCVRGDLTGDSLLAGLVSLAPQGARSELHLRPEGQEKIQQTLF